MAKGPNKPLRHGNGWRIRWTDPHTKARSSETFKTFREAERALRKHLADVEVRREEPHGPAPQPQHDPTFDELCNEWLAVRAPQRRRPDNDHTQIRSALRPYFGSMKVGAITTIDIERFKADSLKKSRSPVTINHHLTQLVSMLIFAEDLGWLKKRPRARKFKVAIFDADFRYLKTKEEVRRFLVAAREEGERLESIASAKHESQASVVSAGAVFPLFATAVLTGLRLGELVALRWDCVDFAKRHIVVQRSHGGPTKAGDVRYVPILDDLLPLLRAWHLRSPGSLVFPNAAQNMRDRTARIFRETLHRVLQRAKLPKIEVRGKETHYATFHCLRHTFASHWVMDGGDIFKLQKILGHKSISMTQRYAHLAPNQFAGDHGRLSALVPVEQASVRAIRG